MFALVVQKSDGSFLIGQGIGKTFDNNIELCIREISPNYYRFFITNYGKPEKQGLGSANWPASQTILIKEAFVVCPENLNLKWQAEVGASLVHQNPTLKVFRVLSDLDPHKMPSPHIPGSDTFHALEGGTSFYWECFANSHAQKNHVTISDETKQKVKNYLRIVDGYSSTKWPLVERVKQLMSVRPTSVNTNPAIKDIGYYHERWNAHTGENKVNRGRYAFGALYFEGDSNYHYDSPLYCLETALKFNDDAAFELGLEFVKRKWMLGWFKSPGITPIISYASKGEKCAHRIGDYLSGSPEKTWHESTVLYAHLLQDPDLLLLSEHLGENLLAWQNTQVWNRAWGARKIAWYLKNLRVHYVFSENDAFKEKAESFINHCMSKVITHKGIDEMWFANVGNGVQTPDAPWMNGKAIGAILEWIDAYGICEEHRPKIEQMLEYQIQNDLIPIGPDYLHCKYNVWRPYDGVNMSAPIVSAQGLAHNSSMFLWGLAMGHKVFPQNEIIKTALKKMSDLAFGSIGKSVNHFAAHGQLGPSEVPFYQGAFYGPGSMKVHLATLIAARDEWVQAAEAL